MEHYKQQNIESEYIVDLPAVNMLNFPVQTPEYNILEKRALTTATTPKAAVGNIIFRTLKNKAAARTIMAALRDSELGIEAYAFAVPQVKSEGAEKPTEKDKIISLEGFLAEEIAAARGGSAWEYRGYAEQLIDFYLAKKSAQAR